MVRKLLSLVVTLVGIVYLILVFTGQVNSNIKRLDTPEVVLFASILLINSEALQRLGKLQIGKEGISFELSEIKQAQGEIKQNQEIIQASQKEQMKSIEELKGIFESFLEHNKPLVAMLRRASEVSISDKFFPQEEQDNESRWRSSSMTPPVVLSSLLKLAAMHPDAFKSLMSHLGRETSASDEFSGPKQE